MNHTDDGNVEVAADNFKEIEKKIKKAFKGLHSSHKLEFTKIDSAKIKLAGDAVYTVKAQITLDGTPASCDMKIREQPWQRYKRFELTCDDGNKTLNLKCQNVRQSTPTDNAESDSREVGQKLLEFLNEIADRGSDRFCLVDIEKVEVEISEGTKYIITGKVMKSDMKVVPCDFEIYEQPWNKGSQIKMSCSKETFKLSKGK